MFTKKLRITALILAVGLVLAACGGADSTDSTDSAPATTEAPDTPDTPDTTEAPDDGDAPAEPTGEFPEIDPFDVEGDIVTAGSSTVFPLSEAIAALFEDEGYGGQVTIDSIGSGAGFERFCVAGESDISNASRAIKDEEVSQCGEIGREPIEIRVGTDALAVTVSADNYFVDSLTIEELAAVFSGAETWADVNADFPAHPIQLFSPGTDSGTFDFFVEEVLDEDPEPLLSANPQLSEDDSVLVQGVSGDGCTEGDTSTPCAIGYFGFAYYLENESVLKAINVDGVEPNADTVLGEYPLARPLFIYSDAEIMNSKPQVAQFIAFYLNRVNEVIGEVGYFPAPDETIQGAKDAVLAAAGDVLGG